MKSRSYINAGRNGITNGACAQVIRSRAPFDLHTNSQTYTHRHISAHVGVAERGEKKKNTH